jgi:hypothetical protein
MKTEAEVRALLKLMEQLYDNAQGIDHPAKEYFEGQVDVLRWMIGEFPL